MKCTSARDRRGLRESGRIAATVLRSLVKAAQPGVSTAELDVTARRLLTEAGSKLPFLDYRGYPSVLCTSVNDQLVHGLPKKNAILQKGDIVGLDIGADYGGYITDMAVTIGIGTISSEARRLLLVAQKALRLAIRSLKPGMKTGDLGAVIQQYIEKHGMGVVRDLVGHGVGRQLHEDPMIPNFGTHGQGTLLTEGMVIAIEPMVTLGDWHVKTLDDGWTVATADGSLGAHFEHSVVIEADGAQILTQTDDHDPWP